jgi:septum formation protein
MPADHNAPLMTLASASPRRRELLELTGWAFSVCSSSVSEVRRPEEEPRELAKRLALLKAMVARVDYSEDVITLAADTMVVHGKDILGKPADVDQAVSMLEQLRAQEHLVLTAVVLDPGKQAPQVELCETLVPMRDYHPDEVAAYIAGGSPFDKAGAYGIQDPDFHPVDHKRFAGCYANVMGLPLCHLVRAFRRLGYEPPEDVPQRCKQFTGYDCTIYSNILRGVL